MSPKSKIEMLVKTIGHRLVVFSDIVTFAKPFLNLERSDYLLEGIEKYLSQPNALAILTAVRRILGEANLPGWNLDPELKAKLDGPFRDKAKEIGVKFVDFMQTIRVATTGALNGIDMYDSLLLLGSDEAIKRIDLAISQFVSPQ